MRQAFSMFEILFSIVTNFAIALKNFSPSVQWLSVQTHKIGVVSFTPGSVTMKTPLVMNTTGSYLIVSISLEKTQSPVSGFFYAQNRVCNAACIDSGV